MRKQFELIQAIRGIAAVLVVYFHTSHAPKFGAFGVDIFFVLSGAVMAMLMAQGTTGTAFLGRRLARISPLYFLATTAAYAVSCLMPSARTSGNLPTFIDYLKSIAFIPHEAHNGEIVPVLGVGWTLNYEMAFYLCCALACFLATRRRSLIAAVLVFAAAFAFGAFATDSPIGKFYSNPIIAEFVMGLCVWSVYSAMQIKIEGHWALLLLAAVVGFMAWSEWSNFSVIKDIGEWSRPARYMLPAAVLVGLSLGAEDAFQRIRSNVRRFLVLVGDASYAIYLTHVFVIGLLTALSAKAGLPAVNTLGGCLIAVSLSTAVGTAIYLWIEVPIQGRIRRLLSPR